MVQLYSHARSVNECDGGCLSRGDLDLVVANAKLPICVPFHSNPRYETPGGIPYKSDSLHQIEPATSLLLFASGSSIRQRQAHRSKTETSSLRATTRPKQRKLPSHRMDVAPSDTDHPLLMYALAAPMLDSIRSYPRYIDLIRQMGLPQ